MEFRGNVDTRLRKLAEGQVDAIILASAGLERLGLTAHRRECFSPLVLCPAAGQGALAIEARADDERTLAALAFLESPGNALCGDGGARGAGRSGRRVPGADRDSLLPGRRGVQRGVGGGGAGWVRGAALRDGPPERSRCRRRWGGRSPEELLRQGAQRLLSVGAAGSPGHGAGWGGVSVLPLAGRTVLVTRARHQAGQLSEKLRALGAEVLEIPAIEIVPPESFAALDQALRNLSQYQWLIVTSANGVAALAARMRGAGIVAGGVCGHLKIAAVGSATERALRGIGADGRGDAEGICGGVAGGGAGRSSARTACAAGAGSGGAGCDSRCAAGAGRDGGRGGCLPDRDSGGICNSDPHNFRPGGRSPGCGDVYKLIDGYKFSEFAARSRRLRRPASMRAVSIGPITSRTLRENGWEPAAEADPHDLAGAGGGGGAGPVGLMLRLRTGTVKWPPRIEASSGFVFWPGACGQRLAADANPGPAGLDHSAPTSIFFGCWATRL